MRQTRLRFHPLLEKYSEFLHLVEVRNCTESALQIMTDLCFKSCIILFFRWLYHANHHTLPVLTELAG